jgi:hypothetical protein
MDGLCEISIVVIASRVDGFGAGSQTEEREPRERYVRSN